MTPGTDPHASSSRSGWAWLALAIGWVAVVRAPIVLNAGAHLDSDLAVDGLTLLEAVNGHWRWHYPATPFIGILPVLLSWPQAMIWGPGPITLVSGGVVAYVLLVLATWVMNRRAFGPSVAAWGLVPLAFASTGTIWLSGRVTGGHLMAAAWHAGAFALVSDALRRGGWARSAALGLWCGLGLYLDSMFVVTLGGVIVAASLGWWWSEGSRAIGRAIACVLAFGLAAGVGAGPRFIGERVDPHDAYQGQLEPDTRAETIQRNAKILVMDCLPRLVAGHRLPGLQAEPDPGSLPGASRSVRAKGISGLAVGVSVASLALLALFLSGIIAQVFAAANRTPPLPPGGRWPETRTPANQAIARAIGWGLLASMAAVLAGFLVNRTIANSDNYRYLVTMLVPWSSGFGLLMARIASRKPTGKWLAGSMALAFAALMAVDSFRWYSGFGWIDSSGRPVRKVVEDPALAWLKAHREVTSIQGDYWDVYRLSFLTGGRVRGVPFSEYPERFPEIARILPGGRPDLMIDRPGPVGPRYRARALAEGGREVERSAGFVIVEWPRGTSP